MARGGSGERPLRDSRRRLAARPRSCGGLPAPAAPFLLSSSPFLSLSPFVLFLFSSLPPLSLLPSLSPACEFVFPGLHVSTSLHLISVERAVVKKVRGGNPRGTAHRAEACGLSPSGKAPPRHDAESRLWLQLAAEETETLAARAREIAEPCEIRHRSETAATIRKSVQEASEGGAAMAHRWTRIPEQWRPDIVQREFDGASTTTADPGAAVEEERK